MVRRLMPLLTDETAVAFVGEDGEALVGVGAGAAAGATGWVIGYAGQTVCRHQNVRLFLAHPVLPYADHRMREKQPRKDDVRARRASPRRSRSPAP
jgi:hypothetical protein